MIAGLYMAAGESSRFGSDKLLHPLEGMPLYAFGLSQALASRLGEVRVVLGPESARLEGDIAERLAGEPKLHIDRNDDPARGMMSSLKTALRRVTGRCDGAMVLLADMPLVTAIMIDALIDAFDERAAIVIAESGGEPRHPRVIPERLFPEFLGLADDEKGTKVIDKYPGDIVRVPIGSELNYLDVDTPEDLKALENL
jgi:molybdenum cofactor cytidylyltransferase